MKKIGNSLFYLVIFAIIFTSIILVFQSFITGSRITLFGHGVTTTQSESMKPTFSVGDLLIYKKIDIKQIKEGDVILYQKNKHETETHRVVGIEKIDDAIFFETKGDDNKIVDFEKVIEHNVIGRVEKNIPLLGAISIFLNTREGLVSLIAVIFTFILIADFVKQKVKKRELINEII